MGLTSAALVAVWIVVIVLVLAMAAMRQQIRVLQSDQAGAGRSASARKNISRFAITQAGRPTIVLLISEGCPSCGEVLPLFTSLSGSVDTNFVVLARKYREPPPDVAPAEFVTNPELFNYLDPGWQPAMIKCGAGGDVEMLEPVGSAVAFQAAVRRLGVVHP